MELILIRHGLPVRTEAEPGVPLTPPDPELSTTGRRQAELAAEWLADEEISAIYSSPLRRAVQTAEPLAASLDLPIVIDETVHEIDFGEDSYIPVEQLLPDDPRAHMWREVLADQGSELVVDFRARISAAIDSTISRHPGEKVVIACHAGVITAALASVLGLVDTFVFHVDYASVTRIRAGRNGRVSVRSVNEHSHLARQRI